MIKCILDIKTGKGEPWAQLQTAAYSLMEESPELEFNEELHRYQFRGSILPSVTGILKDEGFIDASFYTEYARDRGSYVHKAIEFWEENILDEDTLDTVLEPYVDAWKRFRRESRYEPEIIERPMINIPLLYCGKPDSIGTFPSGSMTRGVVELRKDGTYKLIPHKDHADIDIWRSIMAVFNWKKNNLKRR
jgi:hypothetical protein